MTAGTSVKWVVGLDVVVALFVFVVTGCGGSTSQVASPMASPMASQMASEVAPIFRQVLPQLEEETELPVLLPAEIPLPEAEIHADAEATPQAYAVHLGYTPGCRGTACFYGMFAARRTEGEYYAGEGFEKTVRLAEGIEGHYNPVRCAASCGPAVLEWTRDGVRYRFALKAFSTDSDREQQVMIRLARSAIAAGDRASRSRVE